MTTADLIAGDIAIILGRLFKGRTITYFGADGGGRYGRSDFPQTSDISQMDILLRCDDPHDPTVISASVKLTLSNYDARVTGHVLTDQNFRIGLDQLCSSEHVDPKALDWGDLADQEDHAVCLKIDVPLLLAW